MKHDVSNKISETAADYSVSHRQIARAAGVSHSTVSRASKAGYMVTKPVRDTINGSGLVDDAIESAHSREKAELQKALAARISEVQNLAADVAYERQKNETQYQSIGQCLDEIERLKRLVALRTQDLSIYQKALETTDNRADDAEYKAAEFERDLTVQRAWTWLFVLLAFVAAVVGVVK